MSSDLAQPSAGDDAAHAPEKQVFHIARPPGGGLLDAGVGQVLKPLARQCVKQGEGNEVGQPIPVHGHGAELQGDGVCGDAPCYAFLSIQL